MPDAANGFHRELTDEQKAQMGDFRKQREEKLEAFINSLSSEQRALYDAMTPAKPVEGKQPVKPDDAAVKDMKQKHEAFIASLSESQKAAYDELFAKRHNKELTDEQKAQMEDFCTAYDELLAKRTRQFGKQGDSNRAGFGMSRFMSRASSTSLH